MARTLRTFSSMSLLQTRWLSLVIPLCLFACQGSTFSGNNDVMIGDPWTDASGDGNNPGGGTPPPGGGTPPPEGGGGTTSPAACVPITTFADGLTPAVEIHVAETGSDSNGDGSVQAPYATIARGAQDLEPGYALRIHPGQYPGGASLTNLSGTANAPIWIGGSDPEDRPHLIGGSNGLRFSRIRYVVIHDLELDGATYNGINCDDGGDRSSPDATQFVIFRNLFIHDVGANGNEDCLKLSGVDDYFVLGSQFTRCGGNMSGSGIDHVGCHHGLIAGNTFSDLSGNGVQTKGGSFDIEIRGNYFSNAGARALNMGGSTGFQYFRPPLSTTSDNAEAQDIRAISNLIIGSPAAIGFVGCDDCLAIHNTIVDPEHWILRILQETTSSGGYTFVPSRNGRFVNNLVYFNSGLVSPHVNIGPNTAPQTFSFENNLWYAHNNPSQSTPNLPSAETGGIYGVDPLLANPAGGDYSMQSGSPAEGAGLTDPRAAMDYTGSCLSDPPSIGAFETQP